MIRLPNELNLLLVYQKNGLFQLNVIETGGLVRRMERTQKTLR